MIPAADGPDAMAGGWSMRDRTHLPAMAAAAWTGAALARPFPVFVVAAVIGLCLIGRRRWWLVAAVGLLAGELGHRAESAFVPVESGVHRGQVAVVDEPERLGGGWQAVVRLADGRRVRAVGFGPAGARLAALRAGQRVVVGGWLQPVRPSAWSRSRHLLGELQVDEVARPVGPGGPRSVAEAIRSAVMAGAEALPADQQALYTGLVVGEDRLQSDAQRARFRAAGLTHLLAVSGQNVAFVLAVVAVPAARLGRRARLAATALALLVFAVITRMEPSVLRASVMAAVSAWAAFDGREADGLRVLAVAVTTLVLVDPFLVWSVGFQLSVAATAAIVLGAVPVAERLPVPAALAVPVGVTLAAQIGVAPLLIGYFDAVPLASIPANVLAGWAAGAVMVWGLTVGVVAGAAPEPIAGWLQLPASALLWWLDAVAAWSVRLPLPWLGPRGAALAAAGAGAWVALGARGSRSLRTAGRTVLAAALISALIGVVPAPPDVSEDLDGGGRWYPGDDGGSVLVVEQGADRRLLEVLLRRRITAIDTVVAERGGGPSARIARAVDELVVVGRLYGPPRHRIVGAHRLTGPLVLRPRAGPLTITPDGPDAISVAPP